MAHIHFLLDPIEPPQELRREVVDALRRDDATIFEGFISDNDSGEPLPGVRVRTLPSGGETVTDARGFYRLLVPVQTKEQRATASAKLIYDKNGYRAIERQHLELWPRGDWTFKIQLERGGGKDIIDERSKHRNSVYDEPEEEVDQATTPVSPEMLAAIQPAQNFKFTPHATLPANATVRIPRSIRVQDTVNGVITNYYVTMNYYCKHVLPHEWLASWNTNALNAGAVAVLGYAINRYQSKDADSDQDICGNSDCQNYKNDSSATKTDNAVDYMTDYVMLNSDGSFANTEYSSENNQMGFPCGDGFTAPTDGCLYDPICVGKDKSGHGRGMCQVRDLPLGQRNAGLSCARCILDAGALLSRLVSR